MQRGAGEWGTENLSWHKGGVSAAVVFAQANPNEKHALFMTQFRTAARAFEKPILFIHGDGHHWLHDDPWLESNIVRVQVDKGGIAPPLQVTVTTEGRSFCVFDRIPFKEGEK